MGNIFSKLSGSTRRVTFGLSIIQLFKAFLSFFTVIISSTYFGTSLGRDVWLLSLSISLIIGSLIFGPIFEIFRAKIVMIKESDGEKTSLEYIGSLLTYFIIISTFIIIIAEILPSFLGKTFAPTYTLDQQNALIIMIRLIMPTMLFSLVVSIITAVLNVYNIYYVTEIMTVLSSVLNVIIIILLAPTIGIYSVVISNYLSNIILLIFLFFILKRSKIPLFMQMNFNFKPVIIFFKFALPFYFNYFIAQVLLAVEKIISTFLGVGSLSVLDYARKFVSIPISVIQSTVNVVLTATLAKKYILEGEKAFILELNKFIDMVLLGSLPLIVLFLVCPVEIVKVFLLRGAFDPKFVTPTSNALFWFGFGIVSIIFYSACAQALVSQGKTKTTAIISGSLGFFVLAINLLFYSKFGVQLLAFSWSFGHLIAGVIMYFSLSTLEFRLLMKEFLRKVVILISICILSYFSYYYIIETLIKSTSIFANILKIVSLLILSIFFELIFIFLLKFNERVIISKLFNSCLFKLRLLK